MLKKEVCKRCRIEDYGKAEGWNEFCDAWFETNDYRPGHVYCPPKVTIAVHTKVVEKMKAALTYEESDLESVKFYLRKLLDAQCIYARTNNPPPWWCPRAAEHGVVG